MDTKNSGAVLHLALWAVVFAVTGLVNFTVNQITGSDHDYRFWLALAVALDIGAYVVRAIENHDAMDNAYDARLSAFDGRLERLEDVGYYESHQRIIVEARTRPPVADEDALVGLMWCDTSLAGNAVMKYWDGDEWVRMDGGGEIPDGMITVWHLSEDLRDKIDTGASALEIITPELQSYDRRLDELERRNDASS